MWTHVTHLDVIGAGKSSFSSISESAVDASSHSKSESTNSSYLCASSKFMLIKRVYNKKFNKGLYQHIVEKSKMGRGLGKVRRGGGA